LGRKAFAGIMLTLLLIGVLTWVFNIQPVEAEPGTIYIRADGSVDPPAANITSVDNVTYTFTGNIHDKIVVERDNIVVDGIGYTLQGTGSGDGISVLYRSNITIKNIEIKAFNHGIYLEGGSNARHTIFGNILTANNDAGIDVFGSSRNSISGNNITNNGQGVYLRLTGNNIVSENNIANNERDGIILVQKAHDNTFFGNSIINNNIGVSQVEAWDNNRFYHNNFINNTQQAGFFRYLNYWNISYPSGGNYWSDYTGEDLYSGPYQNETGNDGIGDTPYVISQYNQDNYPFIKSWGWDKTPPVTINDYDGLWHTANFTVALTATDGLSGITETYYKIDGSPRNVTAHGQPLIATESVNNTLEYWSVDFAGNEETPHNVLTKIKLDKTAPAISITSPSVDVEIRSSNPAIEWSGTDTTSGIDHYEIRLDNSSWTNMGTNTTYTFTGVGDGTHIADVKAFDKAGKPQITSVRFTVNTSPIGGPGYTEEIAITVVVLLAVASAIYLLKVRKKHLKRFL
jgi:parallel beta-helix repeat protein